MSQGKAGRQRYRGGRTLESNRPKAGTSPTRQSKALLIMSAVLPSLKPMSFCCSDTAKKMDTEVGGAMMNGCKLFISGYFRSGQVR